MSRYNFETDTFSITFAQIEKRNSVSNDSQKISDVTRYILGYQMTFLQTS